MNRIDEGAETAWAAELDAEGCTVLQGLLTREECEALAALDADGDALHAALHTALHELRHALQDKLLPVAARWRQEMGLDGGIDACHDGVRAGTSTLLRLRQGERLALRHHEQQARSFPLQAWLLLREPGRDFTGGEFALVEQRPRMQSRPIVLPLRQGDVGVFPRHRRPHQGTHGVYRVSVKHGVSRVRSGEWAGVELLF